MQRAWWRAYGPTSRDHELDDRDLTIRRLERQLAELRARLAEKDA
jgi:hypothetical protein